MVRPAPGRPRAHPAALVEAHGEELAQLETLNQGKSINLSRMLDVGASVEFMRYMAG